MAGILYGAGVGPGDPEYMTLKVVRLIRENDVIAVPGPVAKETVAYKIAVQAVPELADKILLPVYMPMMKDREEMDRSHEKAADMIEPYLKEGKNVVYLVLGDSTIYCTYAYVQRKLEGRGYQTQLISGVPSFCAAAAYANISLVEWNEELHVIPSVHETGSKLDRPGTYVLMKSGSRMKELKEQLRETDKDVVMISNCGMEDEAIYRSVDEIPDESGYYSLIIAKDKKDRCPSFF